MELGGQFLLVVGVDVPEDGVTVLLVTHHDAALPATIITLAHHAVAGRFAFCHLLFTYNENHLERGGFHYFSFLFREPLI